MKYGMNLLLWTDHLHDGLLPTLEKIKKLGYDGVEIPLFDLSLDYAAWGRRLDDLGLERTASPFAAAPIIRSAPMPKFAPPAWPLRRKRSIAARPRERKIWSGPITRLSANSPARARRPTNGIGASKVCGKWPSMPSKPASGWRWNI